MKHLRLFESTDLYQRIRIPERNSKLQKITNFDKNDINRLKDLVESNNLLFIMDSYMSKERIRITNKGNQLGTCINKLEDEWFIVLKNAMVGGISRSYLCDTLDGVIDCLNKEGYVYN